MKYNHVVSFGDSFTWGTDLSDCTQTWPHGYSKLTWPALLAEHIGAAYTCRALGGASNSYILRSLIKRLPLLDSNTLVILNWTYIDRWEFFNSGSKEWETLRPSGTENHKFFDCYFKNLHSQYWNIYESLKNILFAHELLKNRNVKFISTCLDTQIINEEFVNDYFDYNNKSLDVRTIISLVKDDLSWFNNHGFVDWANTHNFPLGKTKHPLEEAHQAAFEYIKHELNI